MKGSHRGTNGSEDERLGDISYGRHGMKYHCKGPGGYEMKSRPTIQDCGAGPVCPATSKIRLNSPQASCVSVRCIWLRTGGGNGPWVMVGAKTVIQEGVEQSARGDCRDLEVGDVAHARNNEVQTCRGDCRRPSESGTARY